MTSFVESKEIGTLQARLARLETELKQLRSENEALQRLNWLNTQISASLSIQQVLDTVLDAVPTHIPFDTSSLLLVQDDQLWTVATRGFANSHLALNVYPRSSWNTAWDVVQHREPRFVADVQASPLWEGRPGLEHIRAWMGVPLVVKDHVTAVLTFDCHQPDIYGPAEAELLSGLVRQAAMAIENAALFETIKRQRDQMAELQSFNQATSVVLSLEELLPVVVTELMRILGGTKGSLWFFDSAYVSAFPRIWYEAGERQPLPDVRLSVATYSYLQGLLVASSPLMPDSEAELGLLSEIDTEAEPGRPVLIPLRDEGRTLGFVLTNTTERREVFLLDRLGLAMNVANQAALSIRGAGLRVEAQRQAERLRLVNEVSRQINTLLDVEDILSTLVKTLVDGLGYEAVAAFTLQPEVTEAALACVQGRVPAWFRAGAYWQPVEQTVLAAAIAHQGPLLVSPEARSQSGPLVPDTNFETGVIAPLLVDGIPVAIIAALSEQVDAFDEHDTWLLGTLSKHAATALENTRLYRDASQRLNDLAVLNEASQALVSTLDLDEMLALMMQKTCAALTAAYGYVLLVHEKGRTISCVAAVGPGAERLRGYTIPLDGSIIGTVIRQDKTLLINDTSALPEFFTEIDAAVGSRTRSLMVVPLKNKGLMLGSLIVTNKHEQRFTPNNLNLLIALGQLASGAIENARLFQQVQRYSQDMAEAVADRTAHLEAVNQTSRTISRILAMDPLFANVARRISQLFEGARVALALRTANYITFQKVEDGYLTRGLLPPNHRLKIDPDHILGQVILSGEADFVEQITSFDLYVLADSDEPPTPAMVVPLHLGGKTTGLIVVQNQTWLDSQARDLETLQSLASQVAVAIENARLLQKSRETAIEQERTRLARDMHDGVAQSLAYLLIQVDRCIDLAERNSDRLMPELENMGQVLQHNIEELRRHIFDLRPATLENGSFVTVLNQTAREFAARSELQVDCVVEGEIIDIPAMVETSLYRIVQEALSNIRQHARCYRVRLTLEFNPDHSLCLSIQDDGRGFDAHRVLRRTLSLHGLGLVSMQERIRSLGGTFDLETAPGQGTRISVTVPNLREMN